MASPRDRDDVLAAILETVSRTQEDVRQIILNLHGGKNTDGRHVSGLLDEFDALRGRVSALEGQTDGKHQKWWAVLLALTVALLTKVVDWASGHFK